MNKLVKSILDEGLEGILLFMFMGTFCLCLLLASVSLTYIGIHLTVDQCHIQEEL